MVYKITAAFLAAALGITVPFSSAFITEGECAYNTVMCCWSSHAKDKMVDNTDVCSLVASNGKTYEYPGDIEGDTHCEGTTWSEGTDFDHFIRPLALFIRDNHSDEGYDERVGRSRECDCIENMPVVSRADCTTYSETGLRACKENDLLAHHTRMGSPGGNLTEHLVGECNDVVNVTPDSCKYNAYMCCWTKNDGVEPDGKGMQDNTDVCRVGDTEYPGETEGDVHCHGLTWEDGASFEGYVLPLINWVQIDVHRENRGYFGSLPGAPMCGCIEDMPQVSRSDCSTYNAGGAYAGCGSDLRSHYEELGNPEMDFNLVNCDNEDV